MFKFFRKKSEIDKLQSKYDALQKKSFELSKVNRRQSDILYAEAMEVLAEIEKLKKLEEKK